MTKSNFRIEFKILYCTKEEFLLLKVLESENSLIMYKNTYHLPNHVYGYTYHDETFVYLKLKFGNSRIYELA
jgi:hypothetical protein